MTEIYLAISSSSASITVAVAAIAEPPHMEEPTPTKIEIFEGILINLLIKYAIIGEVEIVDSMINKD